MTKNTLIALVLLTSCAQFVPPTGGKKDEIPPKLILSIPETGTKNFKGSEIYMEFDELIETNALRQELRITPEPKGSYNLKSKAYSVLLKFSEPFQDSTTYTLNFLNGIKDLSERNPANNLKIVFSTGDVIDSLKIEGKVKELWTGKQADKITVGLYSTSSTDTLPILKRKPNYFFKTDTSGSYFFENIKHDSYRIVAFQDLNNNLIFDEEKEVFGFLPDTINLQENITNSDLYTYPQNRSAIRLRRSLARENSFSLEFNKNLKNVDVSFTNEDSLVYQKLNNEIIFYKHPQYTDTLLTNILVVDSVDNRLVLENQKIYFQNFNLKSNNKIEAFSLKCLNIENQNILKNPIRYTFQSSEPIASFNSEKIILFSDSTNKLNYTITWLDSAHTTFNIETVSPFTNTLTLQIPSNSITTYKSDTNRTYTLINNVYPQDKLANLSGQITGNSPQYIVQLIQANNIKVIESQIVRENFKFVSIPPDNYYIRIIADSNSNGYWDTSHFELNKLPEKVYIYPKLLQLKANFEISDIKIDIM